MVVETRSYSLICGSTSLDRDRLMPGNSRASRSAAAISWVELR